jgi:hypothetical protein
MKRQYLALSLLFGFIFSTGFNVPEGRQPGSGKPRTVILTDGEVDDMDSFIRMLLYSNEFDIEGLIYTSSMWHYAGDGKGTLFSSEMPMSARIYDKPRTDLRWTGTQWMEELIDKYSVVYGNLTKHDKSYPSPRDLKRIIRIGNIDFEGEMAYNTKGSDFIKEILLENKPGPVYFQAWGGANTLARALKSIEEENNNSPDWKNILKRVSEKVVLYNILDQDATCKKYIYSNWPEIKIINNFSQFWCFAYAWPNVVPPPLKTYLEGEWMVQNIKFNHGPLLENYYCWGDGLITKGDPENNMGNPEEAQKQNRARYDFISEGDSPAYLYLLDFGLRNLDDPSFGGLGGRFVPSVDRPNIWVDGEAVTDFDPYTSKQEASYPQVRWIEVLQNDFAARADWCVSEFAKSNHAPVVNLNHPDKLDVKPGAKISLSADATDPDGNTISYNWWQYREAGSYMGEVRISGNDKKEATLIMPSDAGKGQTIHIIIEARDNGVPVLTRFRRIVLNVVF